MKIILNKCNIKQTISVNTKSPTMIACFYKNTLIKIPENNKVLKNKITIKKHEILTITGNILSKI